MCLRFASAFSSGLAATCFQAAQNHAEILPSWNIKPGSRARIIRHLPGSTIRRLDGLTWGLIPGFVKSARQRNRLAIIPADRVTTSRITKAAFASRRCLVPASSFYEMSDRPRAVECTERTVLALAGLWEAWRNPVTQEICETFAIITELSINPAAIPQAAVPLLIHPDHWSTWLGGQDADARDLLTVPPTQTWRRWAVSRRVVTTNDDDPVLLLPFEQLRGACTGVPRSQEPPLGNDAPRLLQDTLVARTCC